MSADPNTNSLASPIIVRQFRQIVLWPLQLVSYQLGRKLQRHWEALEQCAQVNPWSELTDEFSCRPEEFQERHYKEFVTFLPYVQRFLYGEYAVGGLTTRASEPSIRTYRRRDIAKARLTYDDNVNVEFTVAHVDLHFFLDADVIFLAFEIAGDELPLSRVQDTLFRFGRAYPAFWDRDGAGGNCLRRVEWLSDKGATLCASDYEERSRYLAHVGKHRSPRFAAHWEYLLRPLIPEYAEESGPLRYRQLEYYRLPLMSYLAVDDPTQLSRADFVRLGLVTRPAGDDALPYSEASLADFEAQYCEDRFWLRNDRAVSGNTRLVCAGNAFSAIGEADDRFYVGRETGFLGQFRHQYFLLFLIAHFHKAALLSLSDRLAFAMSRLEIGDTDSVREFKRHIRQSMEIFLRFSHRYWFHEVSNQPLARDVFRRIVSQLGNETLYEEVRLEVQDMNHYLDSDSLRRQANTVLRLTVVTVFGLIGTVVTGFWGMNLVYGTDEPWLTRIALFTVTTIVTTVITFYTVVRSKRLADFLDGLSDERVPWAEKWRALSPRK
jgi:hypothetical protein